MFGHDDELKSDIDLLEQQRDDMLDQIENLIIQNQKLKQEVDLLEQENLDLTTSISEQYHRFFG